MTTSGILVWADGTANSEAYWSERNNKWVFVDFLNHGQTELVDIWVEVALDDDEVDPGMVPDGFDAADCGLNQATIACDLEAKGRWVVDIEDFADLQTRYGKALSVTSVGTHEGEVLTGETAEAYLAAKPQ